MLTVPKNSECLCGPDRVTSVIICLLAVQLGLLFAVKKVKHVVCEDAVVS